LVSGARAYFESAVSMPAPKGQKPIVQMNNDELEWSDPISEVIP
jgi:hypothetical protein